jgi:N-acetylmuramoyl-L-alanine amidase
MIEKNLQNHDAGRRRVLRFMLGGSAFLVGMSGLPVWAAAAPKPVRKPQPPRLLMLDPGHGGKDPGAIGAGGLQEKDVVLDLAKKLAMLLEDKGGIKVVLTRAEDRFLLLQDRVALARSARADLFVSLHADSAPSPSAHGLSAYTLSSKASDDFAHSLEKQENNADGLGKMLPEADPEVADILMDLTARHTRNASLFAKKAVISGVGRDVPLLENPMRSANFAVLRAPDVPSMLIETGFLSNPKDAKRLSDPAARARIASVLARELQQVLQSPLFVV